MLQPARALRRRVDRPRAGQRSSRHTSPLDVSYAQAGLAPPLIVPVGADDVPAPYRSLLVHEGEMTRTLEEHIGGRIEVRVLSTLTRARFYFRRVLLVEAASGRPVAMGAVRLALTTLPRAVRAEIGKGEVPLGRILRAAGLDFISRPTGYVTVTPNRELMGLFWMRTPDTLYGRETEILLRARKIGEIVEILPRA